MDSLRLFSREKDFPETFSLAENQFSGKTYFIQFVPVAARAEEGAASRPKGETAGFAPSSLRNSSGFIFEGKIVDVLGNLFIFAFDLG